MKSHESEEMYLETIYKLSKVTKEVKAIRVAEILNISRASTSRALAKLKNKNLISLDNKSNIFLTEEGLLIAEKIFSRHKIITDYLVMMGASLESAEYNACRIEHVVTDDIMEIILKKLKK